MDTMGEKRALSDYYETPATKKLRMSLDIVTRPPTPWCDVFSMEVIVPNQNDYYRPNPIKPVFIPKKPTSAFS